MHTASPHSPVVVRPDLLLVEDEADVSEYLPSLQQMFRVAQASTAEAALRHMKRVPPAFVVTELNLADGLAEAVCRAAKALQTPATVLVTTAAVERVPDAITAGCDAVLLKPFAPNLLFARLGRLQRSRFTELQYRSLRHGAKSTHLRERTTLLLAGTNQEWPNTHCPYCAHRGVTSFEFTSYRRAWYACLECRKVWLAKRQE